MNKEIFKAYDVRGIYPTEINEDIIYKIGRATVQKLNAKKLAVGRDARDSGKKLLNALIQGINDAGCDVINLDLITTPMLYFASHQLKVDGAISITASHNPKEYNGAKICRRDAIPVGGASGLNDIRDLVIANNFEKSQQKGITENYDIKPAYYKYFSKFANFKNKKFKIVVDCANTMGVLELPFYKKYFSNNFEVIELYCNLKNAYRDSHEANPLKTDTLKELQLKVVSEKADLGIAYDGDADRVGFIDEKGKIIPMDLVTGLISKILLGDKNNLGSTILYDLRSSEAVKEIIEENGGVAHECRVGHAFIKEQMRKENAIFAGELSGHYYFQANKNGEVSTLAVFILLNLMAETKQPISELAENLHRYFHSGEINSEVKDKEKVLIKLKEKYSDGDTNELDGIKISFWNKPEGERWWFNVRASNTEPVLRLNLEADNEKLMQTKRDEILKIITTP